jgi:hypothetical protein
VTVQQVNTENRFETVLEDEGLEEGENEAGTIEGLEGCGRGVEGGECVVDVRSVGLEDFDHGCGWE